MLKLILRMLRNRVASNALWIVICKGLQAVIGIVISMISARLLGPENFGLINYAASLVFFLTPVAQLGMTSTLVQELVADPDREGEILGTAMLSTLVSSVLCIVGIQVFVSVANPGEPETKLVCGLYSLLLVAQSAEMIQYWFHAKLMSRFTAVTTLITYALVSVYQIVILVTGRSVSWFAITKAMEYSMIAVALLLIFRKQNGCRLSFSMAMLKKMLGRSAYYMLANLLVMVFAQSDRLMIKTMISDAATGFYSAAVVCANATDFIFFAVIDSMRPVILEARKKDEHIYEKNMSSLYAIVLYLSLFQSLAIAIFAKPMVYLLYGAAYEPSVSVLRLIIWYTAFSYIGSARVIWIQAEGKQRLLWKINLCGALANIVLNWLLIPVWGIGGAAFASLITQMFNNVGIGFVMPSLKKNNELLLRGANPRTALRMLRQIYRHS